MTNAYFIALSSPDFLTNNLIDNGTFGKVYKWKDAETDLQLAVKLVKITNEYTDEEEKCMEQDLKKCTEMDRHKRIVHCFGARIKSQQIYIFMEHMAGVSFVCLRLYGVLD